MRGGAAPSGCGSEVADRRRIVGVDVARGVALLGMVATHVYPGSAGWDADGDPMLSPAYAIAAGRSAAAFAVLAGVALVLSTARLTSGQARVSTFTRALGIGAIGLALGYADSGIAVILAYYALLFILAVPLLRAPTGLLLAVAALAMIAVPVASLAIRDGLPLTELSSPTFHDLVASPAWLTVKLGLTGFYPALAWLGYLCVGMALARLDLRSTRVAGWLFAGGAALAVTAVAASRLLLGPLGGRAELADPARVRGAGTLDVAQFINHGLYGNVPTDTWWWLAVHTPHSSTPLDLLHTTGTAVALLGLALLVARSPLLLPLAAVGTMTLTWYTVHVVAMASGVLPENPTGSYLVQIMLALTLALAWRSAGLRGPAEAAVSLLPRAAVRLHPSNRDDRATAPAPL